MMEERMMNVEAREEERVPEMSLQRKPSKGSLSVDGQSGLFPCLGVVPELSGVDC